MRKILAILLLSTALSSCSVRGSLFLVAQDVRLTRLQKERASLNRQTDPIARTKTQIKIADLLLTFVGDAVKSGDMDVVQNRLREYTATIQDAHQTMVNTGRDARRKSGGFKELEIALRRHLRQLDDIGGSVSYDQREPIEKTRDEVGTIRDDLLKALFGSQNAPSRRS